MKENIQLVIILLLSSIFLVLGANSISISGNEAEIFFNGHGMVHYVSHLFIGLLGQNDLALRLPFIIFHILSLFLIYKIGKLFLKRKVDRIVSTAIFALLPGINSAALLVNSASIVIFLTLLFVYLYMYGYKIASYIVLIFALFVDNSFSILYLSLFFYSLSKKDNRLMTFSILLFSVSMYMYGFDDGGKPKGYFLDTFGVYAAIFSPFLFLYYIYSLYRILIKEEKSLLWYISFVAFVFSLLLSFRQRVQLEDFAPFATLAIPLMIKVFFNSYRVRLPEFRKWHRGIAIFVVLFLSINTFFTFVNKPLYSLFKNPKKHFAYKYNIAKELAENLKERKIYKINMANRKLALRLKFYGIQSGGDKILVEDRYDIEKGQKINISYYGTIVARFYIKE
jgi:4-amino-4-deoxy-L-arabinose transferase-like glycosyltransferase